MAQNKQKGPSLSALAALATLAISLWMEVDLTAAIFRSILVYLVFSLITLAYRVVLGRFLAASQAKAEQELLEKIQREAEEEARKRQEQQEEMRRREESKKTAKQTNEPQVGKAPKQPEEAEV